MPESGESRERHGDGAGVTGLGLSQKVVLRASSDVRPWSGLSPSQVVNFVVHGLTHQSMPGWIVSHFVDPVPVSIVARQFRRVLVGQATPFVSLMAARGPAIVGKLITSPLAALALDGLGGGEVGGEEVVAFEKWGLVRYVVRVAHLTCTRPVLSGDLRGPRFPG